jgi:hypothetical protein
VGKSGTGNNYDHLHFEIRPAHKSATLYNPLYYFESAVLMSANLNFNTYPYANEYENPEWRIISYTSKDAAGFHIYWDSNDRLPAMLVREGKTWYEG